MKVGSEEYKITQFANDTTIIQKERSIQSTFLGIDVSVEMTKLPEMNYSNVVSKIDKLLTGWNKRCLTPIGKLFNVLNIGMNIDGGIVT